MIYWNRNRSNKITNFWYLDSATYKSKSPIWDTMNLSTDADRSKGAQGDIYMNIANTTLNRGQISFNILRWINRHIMLKYSKAPIIQGYPVWVYAHIFILQELKKLSFILCLIMYGCSVRRLKVTMHLIYSSYCFPAVPTRWLFRASGAC